MEANHTKTEFLSIMGHELRTPLNAILGYSDIILEDKHPAHEKEIQAIQESSRHLLDVVNDIINISHLETGREQTVSYTFSVADLVKGIFEDMLPLAQMNSNSLELSSPENEEFMHSDSTKIKQGLGFLLRNSLNCTHNQPTVLATYVENNGRICFSVTDKAPHSTRKNQKDSTTFWDK